MRTGKHYLRNLHVAIQRGQVLSTQLFVPLLLLQKATLEYLNFSQHSRSAEATSLSLLLTRAFIGFGFRRLKCTFVSSISARGAYFASSMRLELRCMGSYTLTARMSLSIYNSSCVRPSNQLLVGWQRRVSHLARALRFRACCVSFVLGGLVLLLLLLPFLLLHALECSRRRSH